MNNSVDVFNNKNLGDTMGKTQQGVDTKRAIQVIQKVSRIPLVLAYK